MNIAPAKIPFLEAETEIRPGCPAILGVPYDKTASFRKGTRNGPDAIREVSAAAIETYSPIQDKDLEDIVYADIGNLDVDNEDTPESVVEALKLAVDKIYEKEALPIILGGEHSISPGAIQAAFQRHPDLVVVQFDAHADLRESYEGTRNSHACAMRRTLDFLPSERLLQVGIRSGTKEEYQELKKSGRCLPADAVILGERLASDDLSSRPIYITFDIDLFDPSEVPGTGTPEAGGIRWDDFESLRKPLEGRNIVGLDIVELSPELDPTGISSALAAKMLREWLLTVSLTSFTRIGTSA